MVGESVASDRLSALASGIDSSSSLSVFLPFSCVVVARQKAVDRNTRETERASRNPLHSAESTPHRRDNDNG